MSEKVNMDYKVSVVIPAHNEERWILKCINSFLNQTYKNIEIIVVDDFSCDNTKKIVNLLSSVIVVSFDKPHGEAAARSEGVRLSKGDVIIQADADAIYPDDFIEKAVRYFVLHENVSCLSLGEIYVNEERRGLIADYFRIKRKASFIAKSVGRKKTTGAVAIRRNVYEKVGYYDSSLPSGTDVDFSNRVEKNGLVIFWLKTLKMMHADPDSLAVFLKRIWKESVFSIVFRKRWGKWPSRLSLVSIFFRNLIFIFLPFSFLFDNIWYWWSLVAIFVFLVESIAPFCFLFEQRTMFFLSVERKKILNTLILPLLFFVQVRISAFAKMYAQLNIKKIRKSISFE